MYYLEMKRRSKTTVIFVFLIMAYIITTNCNFNYFNKQLKEYKEELIKLSERVTYYYG